MADVFLAQRLWLALMLWYGSFASDLALTRYGAKLHRAHGQEHISYEGSYELTPALQKVIDGPERLSTRLWLPLALSGIMVAVVWYLSVILLELYWPFSLLMGGLLMRETAVHLRHFRNLAIYRNAGRPGALSGRIEYARWLVLHQSAVDLWGFAGLFLVTCLLTGSAFFLGGALACGLTGLQHQRLSRKVLPPKS